jgi:hypothetical protein
MEGPVGTGQQEEEEEEEGRTKACSGQMSMHHETWSPCNPVKAIPLLPQGCWVLSSPSLQLATSLSTADNKATNTKCKSFQQP